MAVHRWPAAAPPVDELGVVVHGPVILARSSGVVVAFRCVFAHPGGLQLPVILRAGGVHAEAASRRRFGHLREGRGNEPDPLAEPRLTVRVNGTSGPADASGGEASGGTDTFLMNATYWIGELPHDGSVQITVSWPEVGLAQAANTLSLDNLDDLGQRVVPLVP